MNLDATLDRLILSSPEPLAAAHFYQRTFGYVVGEQGDAVTCEAPGRSLWWQRGAANQIVASRFRLRDSSALIEYAAALSSRGVGFTWLQQDTEFQVTDPEGRCVIFAASRLEPKPGAEPLSARLQHYAVRSPSPATLLDFYSTALGFAVSDLVLDEQDVLRAAFLRSDAEHHSLAIFNAPTACFDHFSCEAADWMSLRDWADKMASADVPMAWGVGRHGPGNDTFFMVRDPDGNLAEISSDLEVCEPGRPVGHWPHKQKTLNTWGTAILRS